MNKIFAALFFLLAVGSANANQIVTSSTGNAADGILGVTNGDCVVGVGGSWVAGSCATGGSFTNTTPYYSTGGAQSFDLSDRAAQVYNVLDFGALGTNSTATVGSLYSGATLASLIATNINGGTPYQYLNNPALGLTFSMNTSAAQGGAGTTLIFTEAGSVSSRWAATVALWQDPAHGNYMILPGMLVTGPACIAANTTVSSVDRAGSDANYGKITLNQSTASACASGATITFTIAPATLQARTLDWLGIQAAVVNAWQAGTAPNGGNAKNVFIPAGYYNVNATVMNPGPTSNSSSNSTGIDLYGAGYGNTTLSWSTDLGVDFYGIGESNRTSSSFGYYHDFTMQGPAVSCPAYGTSPSSMSGLALGIQDKAERIFVGNGCNFGYAIGIEGDHATVLNSWLESSGCAIHLEDYSQTFSNEKFENIYTSGNRLATICVGPTNTLDGAELGNIHNVQTPYVLTRLASTTNITSQLNGCITNSTFSDVWADSLGNGYTYCPGTGTLGLVNNVNFTGGGPMNITSSSGATISGTPLYAVFYQNQFTGNNLIGTNMTAAYGTISTAIVDSNGASAASSGNIVIGDVGMVTGSSGSIPPFTATGAVSNSFLLGNGSGVFEPCAASYSAGELVGWNSSAQVVAFTDGEQFEGITAGACGSATEVAVYTSEDNVTVNKAVSSEVYTVGTLVRATSTNAVAWAYGGDSIGVVIADGGGSTMTIHLSAHAGGGSPAFANALTATGTGGNTGCYATTTANNNFTTVASGTCAILPLHLATSTNVWIKNSGANSLGVCPQATGTINAGSTGACVTLTAGSAATYRFVSSSGLGWISGN